MSVRYPETGDTVAPTSERAIYRTTCASGNVHLVIAQSITGVEGEMAAIQEHIEAVERVGTSVNVSVFQIRSREAPMRLGYRAIDRILRAVAKFYDLPIRDIKSKRKTKPIVKPRSVVAYLCREHTNYSYSEIGHLLGGRHHTSIMATTKRVREQLETDEVLRHEIRDLVALILPIRPGEGR